MKKTAIITGSSKRIGKEFAIFLAKQGYNIALHYNKSKKKALRLKEILQRQNIICEAFKADLSNTHDISLFINDIYKKFKNIDILINNASIFEKSLYLETNEQELDNNMNIHFKSPFFLSKFFAKKSKKGIIINMIDTRITKNHSKYFSYTLSKKILNDFTKMSAIELAPNIRVNAIAPGFILPSKDTTNDMKKFLQNKIPLKRKGKIENILQGLDYLINNTYVTGETLFIDGGEHLL